MSEYWVSKKKYWCQYCEIYIADDVPSRAQHENGLRHKGNKDRFIRSLYKAGVKKKNDTEEEKREMKRVELAAQAAYARDIGAGHASASSSSSTAGLPTPTPAPKPRILPPKPSDPYTNYTTAASLGISDPDADRLIEEAKMRKSEGRAGDWVSVVPPPPPLPQGGDTNVASQPEGVKLEREEGVGEVRKRVEEAEDENDTRRFKLRKRTVTVGLGEIYDPGVIRVKTRVQPPVEGETESPVISITTSKQPVVNGPVLGGDVAHGLIHSGIQDTLPGATEKPSWTRREWKRAGGEESVTEGNDLSATCLKPVDPLADEEQKAVFPSEASTQAGGVSLPEIDEKVKGEPTEPVPLSVNSSNGSLFRKRKLPVGSNRGRRKG